MHVDLSSMELTEDEGKTEYTTMLIFSPILRCLDEYKQNY